MNFDLLPGSNVNCYTSKEFPSKWMLTELLVGGGGGGGDGHTMPDQPNLLPTPLLVWRLLEEKKKEIKDTPG